MDMVSTTSRATEEGTEGTSFTITNDDERRLNLLGYKQTLMRTFTSFDNWAVTMGCLYFIGGIQALFGTAIGEGGPVAIWVNWIICSMFVAGIAACLAEICSAYPTAGSIYYWAFKCAGEKWGPLFAWLTAWLNVAGWIMNVAADATAGSEFVLSQPWIYNITSFPTDADEIHGRSVQWAIAVGYLALAFLINLLPSRQIAVTYKLLVGLGFVLWIMNVVWLPIAAHNTYGVNSASFVFTSFQNSTGFSNSYAWLIGLLFPMYTLMGFDASGHLAEETQKSHQSSPKGIFMSFFVSSACSFIMVIMLLVAMPSLEIFNAFQGSSEVAQIVGFYKLALGLHGQSAMIGIGCILFLFNTSITMQGASRIVYAVARDKVLPFSKQIQSLNRNKQPLGALVFTTLFAFILVLTIIPSAVAFSAIASSSVMCVVSSYGLVIFARVIMAKDRFKQAEWNLGPFSMLIGSISCVFIAFILVILALPTTYPLSVESFNYAPMVFFIIVVIIMSIWFLHARKWFKGPVMMDIEQIKRENDGVRNVNLRPGT